MPFKSRQQQKFAYANPDKFGGKKGLDEWSADTNFSDLPEKVASGASDENNSPKAKKFSYAPQRTRAGYTKSQRNA